MFATDERFHVINHDGMEDWIKVFSRYLDGYVPLRVEAGHNGMDESYEVAYIRIEGGNLHPSMIDIKPCEPSDKEFYDKAIEITLRGSERTDNVIKALEFILQALKDGRAGLSE